MVGLTSENNVIHHFNGIKDKIHIIISIDIERAFNKTQHPFHDKITQQTRNRRELNLIKGIYEKPTSNIILSDERLNVFSLR